VQVALNYPVQIGDKVMLREVLPERYKQVVNNELMVVVGDEKRMEVTKGYDGLPFGAPSKMKIKRVIKLQSISLQELFTKSESEIPILPTYHNDKYDALGQLIEILNHAQIPILPRFRTLTSEPMTFPAWQPIRCERCRQIGEAYIPGRLEIEDQKIVVLCPFCNEENVVQYNHPGGVK